MRVEFTDKEVEIIRDLLDRTEDYYRDVDEEISEKARKARGTSEDEEEFRKMLHRRMEWNARAATAVLYYFRFLTVRAMGEFGMRKEHLSKAVEEAIRAWLEKRK